jgi:stage IV sporulation protein FB
MIKITLHPSIIILLLIGLFGGFLNELLIFLLITFLHEAGHLFTAKIFKVKCHKITLTLIGGFIELEDYSSLNLFSKILINISGIIVNLLIFLFINVININFLDNNIISWYNILMIIFNLLPVAPLDGYKILKNLLEIIFEEEYLNDCLFYLSLIILTIISIILFITKLYGYYVIISFLIIKTIKEKNSKNILLKQYSMFTKL